MDQAGKRREKIDDIRLGVMLIGVIVVAPKLPEYVSDIATGVTIFAMIFVRAGVVDFATNLWRFITRQTPNV